MTAPVTITPDTNGFPVQDTNVKLVLKEAVAREYPAVLARIALIESELEALHRYQDWMERTTAEAGITLPPASGNAL